MAPLLTHGWRLLLCCGHRASSGHRPALSTSRICCPHKPWLPDRRVPGCLSYSGRATTRCGSPSSPEHSSLFCRPPRGWGGVSVLPLLSAPAQGSCSRPASVASLCPANYSNQHTCRGVTPTFWKEPVQAACLCSSKLGAAASRLRTALWPGAGII